MSSTAEQSVLRRKAHVRESAVGPSAMDTTKALRFAMAKAADEVLDVAVGVRDVAQSTLLPDDLDDGLPDGAMILKLGDDLDGIGVAFACLQSFSAVIEASTIGSVLTTEASPRKPTRTDAALFATFLDAVLERFGHYAGLCVDRPPVDGFRSAGVLEDLRAAQLALADETLRRYQITVDFGLGAKVGTLILCVPNQRKQAPAAVKTAQEWSEALEQAVMGTTAQLQANLCTLRLPYSDIAQLKPGDLLPLTKARLDGVSMVGSTGQKALTAKLGRSGPLRAVRLNLAGDDVQQTLTLENLATQASAEMQAMPVAIPAAPLDISASAEPGLGDLPDIDLAPTPGDPGAVLGAIEPMQLPEEDALMG